MVPQAFRNLKVSLINHDLTNEEFFAAARLIVPSSGVVMVGDRAILSTAAVVGLLSVPFGVLLSTLRTAYSGTVGPLPGAFLTLQLKKKL